MAVMMMSEEDKLAIAKKVKEGVVDELPGIEFSGCVSQQGLMIDSDWKDQEGTVTVGIWLCFFYLRVRTDFVLTLLKKSNF